MEPGITPPLTPGPAALPHPALVAPNYFYFSGEDKLRLVSLNSASGVTLTLVGRILSRDGQIIPFVYTQTPNTDRTTKTDDYFIGDGWLMNAAVFASAGTPQVGQCFAMLRVVRGSTGATQELATLAQNFVTSTQRAAWLGQPIQWTTQQPGAVRVVTGTDPAAGVEISETVPTGARWRLPGFSAVIVTDATVGARRAALKLTNGATAIVASAQLQTIAASDNFTCYWATGIYFNLTGSVGNALAPLPTRYFLLAGHKIETSTVFFQAGDNWGAPTFLVEEWLEGA